MKHINRNLIGAVVGVLVGLVFGMPLGLVSAPRHWVTMTWMKNVAQWVIFSGAIGGIVVITIDWLLKKGAVGKRIYDRISTTIAWKVVEVLFGAINGMIIGGIVGAVAETIIGIRKVGQIPSGMLFYVSDFTEVIFVMPVLGAIAGAVHGLVGQVTKRAVSRLINNLCSGLVFGIAVGMFFFVLSLGHVYVVIILAAVFGVSVAVLSEVIGGRLLEDDSALQNGD